MPSPITEQEKLILTHQVYSLFTRHGFDGISMNEIAREIRLSKATIYKYFKSKEDIVRGMVGEIISQLDALELSTARGIDSVLESLSTIYYKAVVMAAYSSSQFITDLQSSYPDLYADFMAALDKIQIRFEDFYAGAVREGYCRELPMGLVGEQVMRMLPAVISPEYLTRRNTTLPEVIREYYKLLLHLMLDISYDAVTAREDTYAFVDTVVDCLRDRFLVDQPQ